MTTSQPVLALSWALFSSPMTHCSQTLCFLHYHLVSSPSWFCSSSSCFLPSFALASSFYLFFLPLSVSCSKRHLIYLSFLCPSFFSNPFILNPPWSWFCAVTSSPSLPAEPPILRASSATPRAAPPDCATVALNCPLVRFECKQRDRSGFSLL